MDKDLVEFLSGKFDRIENRIEQIQGQVNHRFDELETRMTQGFTDVNQRVDALTHTVEEINRRDLQDSNAFAAEIADLDKRVSHLETTRK